MARVGGMNGPVEPAGGHDGDPEPPQVAMTAARNAAVLSAAEILGKVASLGLALMAARRLDHASFGFYSFGLALALLLAVIPSWGFDQLLVQRASSGAEDLDSLVAHTLAWRLLLGGGVLAATALVMGVTNTDSHHAAVVIILVAATCMDTLTDTGKSAAAVVHRQAGVALSLVVQRATTAALAIVALVVFDDALVWVAGSYLVGSIIGLVSTAYVVHGLDVHPRRPATRRAELSDTGRRSLLVGLEVVVAMVLFRVDMPILQLVRGSNEVAVYAVAYRVAETTLFLSWTIGAVALPRFAARRSDPIAQRTTFESSLAAAAAFYIPFAVVAFVVPERILRLLFGSSYSSVAATSLRWLALTPLVFAIWLLGGYILIAHERFWASLVITVVCAVMNIVSNFALLPRFGSAGAAATTTITFAFGAAAVLSAVRTDMGMLRLGRTLGAAIVAGGAMAVTLTLTAALPIVVGLAIAMVVDAVVWWAIARRFAPSQIGAVAGLVGRS